LIGSRLSTGSRLFIGSRLLINSSGRIRSLGEIVHKLRRVVAAVLIFGWGIAGAASADDIGEQVGGAIEAADAGRCDEAFRALSDSDGLESRARLLVAQCRIRTGLYPEALNDLDRIRGASDLTPMQVGDVEFYRAVAFYHLERYAEASAALDRAEGVTGEEAQYHLYSGLLALRDGDYDRAAPALESAARLSPAVTEPVASYYAGLAWQGSAERAKARQAFERVVEIDGDGTWGKEAAKMLEGSAPYPFYVNMSAGVEYDDNVVLRGGSTLFPATGSSLDEFADGEDWRGVWRINAGVQLFEAEDWSAGIVGGYSGMAHHDLQEFDTHYPTIGAYLAHRIDANTIGQVQYQYGFAWVDKDDFMQSQNINLAVSHVWPRAGTTVASTDLFWTDLRFDLFDVPDANQGDAPGDICPNTPVDPPGGCGPNGLNERRERDRDGIGFDIGVRHLFPVNVPEMLEGVFEAIDVSGGYQFRFFDSDGREWKHTAHLLSAGIDVELPLDFRFGTHVIYEHRDFSNPSTFPDREVIDRVYGLSGSDRNEDEVTFEAEVEKDLTAHLSVSARWAYTDSESNRRVYGYSRHIVGGYLNYRFE
jgi:tetratricopeptide (TPR) repeat protein